MTDRPFVRIPDRDAQPSQSKMGDKAFGVGAQAAATRMHQHQLATDSPSGSTHRSDIVRLIRAKILETSQILARRSKC